MAGAFDRSAPRRVAHVPGDHDQIRIERFDLRTEVVPQRDIEAVSLVNVGDMKYACWVFHGRFGRNRSSTKSDATVRL